MQIRSGSRRGAVLVLFVLIVFGLLALAALVIDLGLARVSQRQMQTAADAAALEGLRWRDELPDEARRAAAREAVTLMFADSDDRLHGAGLDIPLLTEDNPLQKTIDRTQFPSPKRFYKPDLQLNETDNAEHGDMVAGIFFAPETGLNPDFDPQQPYRRADFAPQRDGDAFLVRLRMTNDRDGLDQQAGISSRGPAIPYLFGRGSLLAPQGKDGGITVRATAIAHARPVLSVGVSAVVPGLAEPLPGVAPYGLSLAAWNLWRENEDNRNATTLALTLDGGNITGPVTGRFTDPPTGVVMIGAVFPATGDPRNVEPPERYVPLFVPVAGQERVAGFLHLRVTGQGPGSLTVEVLRTVAARNASASVVGPLPAVGSDADVNALFDLNATILDPLRAPALVNRHPGLTP